MKKSPLLNAGLFFAAVYLFSAILYYPIIRSGIGMGSITNQLLMLTIAFVPSILGVVFTYLKKDAEGRRDFWRRTFRWPRGHTKIALVSLLIFPLIILLTYLTSLWIEGNISHLEYAAQIFSNPALLVQFLLVEFFLGAVSEELGWRGYVLDELQSRWSPLTSSLVLGVVWGVWHSPAFVIPGLSQSEMGGLWSLAHVCFILAVTLISVVHTWTYNNTGRSILVAGVLMHFVSNATLIFLGGIFDQFSMPSIYWVLYPIMILITIGLISIRYHLVSLAPRQKFQDAAVQF